MSIQYKELCLSFLNMSPLNRLLPKRKSLWAVIKTFSQTNPSEGEERRCQLFEPQGQGNVIVKPNLLIFELLAGYGCLFFGYALWHGPLLGRFKMVYCAPSLRIIGSVYINHFETPTSLNYVGHNPKKRHPYPDVWRYPALKASFDIAGRDSSSTGSKPVLE